MNAFLTDMAASLPEAAETGFALTGPLGGLRTGGQVRRVASGALDSLGDRVAAGFAAAGPQAVIGGALPFDRDGQDCLWISSRRRPDRLSIVPQRPARALSLRPEPAPAGYAQIVAKALRVMEQDAGRADSLRKIVLARTLHYRAAEPIPVEGLRARLAEDPAVTAFRVALPGVSGPRWLVGGSPELLVQKTGARVVSNPLAGSSPRRFDPVSDAQSCSALASSEKDRREHAMVVEFILDTLSPWCRNVSAPQGTGLTSTRSMWHLGTRIEGDLKDPETPSALLAAALHPTPAVCGLPAARANDLIHQLEPVDREFYAGAVGWCAADGDGAWYVAIRCADISGDCARLYAGAGIVPGSDPAAETAETGNKFAAMLAALGLPADTALQLND